MQRICNIILILILTSASACYAFDPNKHELISSSAASLYETCTGRAMPKESLSAFAKGAADEDEWGLTRALNWHFYNNGNKIGRYWKFILHCNGSNEKIYHKRVRTLDGMMISKVPDIEIYAAAGRVAHHIHDMNVPPHVMPIYHLGDDNFDNYIPASMPAAEAAALCKDVTGTIIEPLELLERAAQNTLKAVAKPVVFADGKTFENETWMKFWGGPDDQDLPGFKTYGEYGNTFGIIPPCKSSVCRAYDRNTFDRFYNEDYMRAVADTVRLFIYLDQRNAVLKGAVR
jgi:hypothetical protein